MEEILDALEQSIDDFVLSKFEKKILEAKLSTKKFGTKEIESLRNSVYLIANEKCTNSNQSKLVKWMHDAYLILSLNTNNSFYCNTYFSPGYDCLNTINKHIQNCQSNLNICVFTISDDRIRSEIVDALHRGVEVRIISDDDKMNDRGSDINYLSQHGAHIRIDNSPHHMHHKFAIFDDKIVLSGSYNWTRSAAEYNHENIIETNNMDALHNFSSEFERLWDAMYEL